MSKTQSRLLEPWQDQSLEEMFSAAYTLLEDESFPTVRRWRESGGKVVGHFQVYFPEEIVHAAGLLPLKIRGGPVEASQASSRFGSYLCSIIKTSLELALTGNIELDMFITHPICDAARNLGAIWGRNFSYPCQILYLPQNANSAYAARYLSEEYARLRQEIEQIADRKIEDEDLQRSIAVFNDNRRLLRELYTIKRERPWLLSVVEAYALVAIGGMIQKEEHNALIEDVLSKIKARQTKEQDRIRVVFEGGFCEQPPLDLLHVLARSLYVVDDDLLIGMRWILEDVAMDGEPLLNLALAYLEQSTYSPVQHDLRKPKEEMLLERIEHSKAGAAIVAAAKMCEPGLDEQVAYSQALDEHEIPYFIAEFEENMTSFDQIEILIETFAENILFY